MKTWRMSFRCGNQGREMWPDCHRLGVAAMTYLPLYKTDLSKFPEGEPKELWAELAPNQHASLRRLVYEMKQGDIIYVKQGPSIVYKGVVVGSYRFVPDSPLVCPDDRIPWCHQVPVEWEPDFNAIDILLGAEPITVLQLSGERLRKLEETLAVDTIVVSDLDSLHAEEEFLEGGDKRRRFTNHYERNPRLRTAAISHHGTKCMVCGFDFGEVYGEHGAGYIEVHHLRPVSNLKKETRINPKADMAVVCSNCHRMLHREKGKVLSPEDLRAFILQAGRLASGSRPPNHSFCDPFAQNWA